MTDPTISDLTITRAEPTWYVGRRIGMTYEDATHALGDLLRRGDTFAGAQAAVTVDTVQHARPGDARGFRGRLRVRGLGRVRISVEIEPWSRAESALGLRPVGRPPRLRADRYFDAAVALLARLESGLRERVPGSSERSEIRRAS
jgi:hypothetical protein